MIKGLIMSLILISLAGCAGHQPAVMVSLPSVAPVRKAVKDTHEATADTKAAVTKAKVAIAAAQVSAKEAAKATTDSDFILKLAPVLDQLRQAQQVNEEALASATVAESRATTAEAVADQLEAKQATAEEEKSKMVERLNYLEPKYGAAVGMLWKWRLFAIGTWVAIGALIAAKFYFKFPFI